MVKRSGGDRVRRAIGPAYADLLCPCCLNASAQGMIAVNGSVYVTCSLCRFKAFGLSPRAIAGFRWILKLLEREGMVERLAAAQSQGVPVDPQVLVPAATEAPAPAPVETARDEAGAA